MVTSRIILSLLLLSSCVSKSDMELRKQAALPSEEERLCLFYYDQIGDASGAVEATEEDEDISSWNDAASN
jgi:hypothetical protein